MRVFYSDHHGVPLPEGHRFPMGKYRALREALLAEGVLASHELTPAPLAEQAELLHAHDPAWVQAVLSGAVPAPAMRRVGFPWSPELVRRSRASVGGTLAAARQALDDGLSGNLAGGTHHAGRDHGEGFCLFNDLAVTALVLLAEGRVSRVAVVDLDVHQGNGTAAILGQHPQVHTLSVHGEHNFPFRKVPGHVDVGLPDGTGDAPYLAALDAVLPGVFDFGPDLVLYLAGVDPLAEDRLGRLSLTAAGLRERDRRVLAACHAHGVPVALTLGGGYAQPIEASVQAHVGTWRAARGPA